MAKRILSEEYVCGARDAEAFLMSWSRRAFTAPWDMGDEFMSRLNQMPQDRRRGFQDAVFLYLQIVLDGSTPIFGSSWLEELEYRSNGPVDRRSRGRVVCATATAASAKQERKNEKYDSKV
jgi:hypothetical protein